MEVVEKKYNSHYIKKLQIQAEMLEKKWSFIYLYCLAPSGLLRMSNLL